MKKIIIISILLPLLCSAMEKHPRDEDFLEARMTEDPTKRQILGSIRAIRNQFRRYFFDTFDYPSTNEFEHNKRKENKQIYKRISLAITQLQNMEVDILTLEMAPKLLGELRQTMRSLHKVHCYLQQQIAYQKNPLENEKPLTRAITVTPMGTISTESVIQRRRAALHALRRERTFQPGSLRFPPQPGKKQ
jgi:hypothetical protein